MGFYILYLPFSCWNIQGEYLFKCGFSTLFTLCPFETKKGEYFFFWTGNVFQTSQVIFIPEWPNGEFASCILLTKSLLCKVAILTGMPNISESSKYFRKAISSVQGKFCANSNSLKVGSHSGWPNHVSGRPSVSRSFEQFKVAFVRTSWQHIWTLFRVREDFSTPFHTRIGKTASTRPDAKATPSGHRDPW